jgi:hypothetical protein
MRPAIGTQVARAVLGRLAATSLPGLLLATCLARPVAACEAVPRTTVPLDVVGARALVVVTVNGKPGTFLLDTGAMRSQVTPEAVGRLGLVRDRWVGSVVRGIGGIEHRSVADPASLTLGGIRLRHRNTIQDQTLAVAPLGAPEAGGRTIDGLLGRDFLSAFDVVVDMTAGRMTLWAVNGCTGRFLPWHVPYDAVAALPAYGDALVLPVQANGEPLRALPDTGTSETVIVAPGMARLGLTGEPHAHASRATGSGGFRTRAVWPLRLSSLRIGNETIGDKEVLGSEFRAVPIVDMVLGADWFAAHRVWLSYATGQVFVAKAG